VRRPISTVSAAPLMAGLGVLVGAGEAQELDIIGETPNLAARLQALAEANTIVTGPNTRLIVGNLPRPRRNRAEGFLRAGASVSSAPAERHRRCALPLSAFAV
jgi:class 3 adenylate cyclase